jgi:hypothetical protein
MIVWVEYEFVCLCISYDVRKGIEDIPSIQQ